MKKALLVTIAVVALAWVVPLHPPTALADANVEVTAPVLSREGSDLMSFTGPTVAVAVAADELLEVTVMVSGIDLVYPPDPAVPPDPLFPPDPVIEIKVCTELEVCTDS